MHYTVGSFCKCFSEWRTTGSSNWDLVGIQCHTYWLVKYKLQIYWIQTVCMMELWAPWQEKCSMLLLNCVIKRNRTLFLEVGHIYIPYSNVWFYYALWNMLVTGTACLFFQLFCQSSITSILICLSINNESVIVFCKNRYT